MFKKGKRPDNAWTRHVRAVSELPENVGKHLRDILKAASASYPKKTAKTEKKKRKCKYGRTKSGKCRHKYGGNEGDQRRSARRDYRRKTRSRKKKRRHRRRRR